MTKDSRNLYLAIGLSCLVIVGWSYFFAPKPDRARQFPQQQAQTAPGAPRPPLHPRPPARRRTRFRAISPRLTPRRRKPALRPWLIRRASKSRRRRFLARWR
ncbi:protein of unknown function [Methylocella tundrae]|uniref:Membrane protein insertase YidC n=1 Tax=Methylocella tundrae TaxID=227605 RepID=A0A4U8YWZ4_METTU|nr:protein of unknown function [Methylocella tundrae]